MKSAVTSANLIPILFQVRLTALSTKGLPDLRHLFCPRDVSRAFYEYARESITIYSWEKDYPWLRNTKSLKSLLWRVRGLEWGCELMRDGVGINAQRALKVARRPRRIGKQTCRPRLRMYSYASLQVLHKVWACSNWSES